MSYLVISPADLLDAANKLARIADELDLCGAEALMRGQHMRSPGDDCVSKDATRSFVEHAVQCQQIIDAARQTLHRHAGHLQVAAKLYSATKVNNAKPLANPS